tara:strand:- start:131 stop:424 length:294 start_codon:yes stop_codon:yes gene_type:complete
MKIDKNIPVSARKYGSVIDKYPWRKMEIGDSIAIPINSSDKVKNKSHKAGQLCRNTLGAKGYFAAVARNNPEYKFSTRIVKENNGFVLRIWRIEVTK